MSELLQSKRVAKNTILLYFRMILGMLVSLYTSRVVLNVLGIDDFGIYNVISGIVVMFSFINTFLTSACQRYISFSIAKNDENETRKVFATSLFIHVIVLILFVTLAETIGLWFFNNKLVIPENRFAPATYVFHIMVVEFCISIFKVPYNAAIISEEKMGYYAWTSIFENILRLVVVFLLLLIPFDKLVVYAFLHIAVSLVMLLWYKLYSEREFDYCAFSLRYDKGYLKEMVSFSGWNLFGSIADVGYKQGTNIILNLFHGVSLNASMGLATTVRSTVYSFISNIQVAANPQIVKAYAIEEYDYYSSLIFRVSKYSYFLMLFLAIPIMINIDFILKLWLGIVPEYAASFVVLGLVFCLVDCLHGPLWTSMQATGRIKYYQLLISIVLLLNLPFSYLALDKGYSPNSILVIQIIISVITLLIRLIFSMKDARVNIILYCKEVFLPIFLVTLTSSPVPLFLGTIFLSGWKRFFITGSVSVIMVGGMVLMLGMKKQERDVVLSLLRRKCASILP